MGLSHLKYLLSSQIYLKFESACYMETVRISNFITLVKEVIR